MGHNLARAQKCIGTQVENVITTHHAIFSGPTEITNEENVHRYASTCSTKELSIHMTKILSAVKEGQQKYCETVYSRSGINHMWILKNSKDLLDNLQSRSFSQVSSIKTFDFSTLYTTLPHDKLETRLKQTIHKAFSHRNYGSKFVVLGYNSTYFSNKIQKGKTCYSEEQVISMLEFLIDNIFVSFGGILFQQVVGIPMGVYQHTDEYRISFHLL